MVRAAGRATPVSGLLLLFLSCLACLYVAGRLWTTTRLVHHLQTQQQALEAERQDLLAAAKPRTVRCKSAATPGVQTPDPRPEDAGILYYSIRRVADVVQPLAGASIEQEVPTAAKRDEALLGAVDTVEAGEVWGWACLRGAPAEALQVLLYVDGIKVGETSGGEKTPHLMINRLCEGETSDSDGSVSARLGFRHQLPPLPSGRHEVRAFVRRPGDAEKQELNQSPLTFIESPFLSDAQQALARKDAIIRVRNAQVSALWDELHTRRPWRTAISATNLSSFEQRGVGDASEPKYLAVIAINTGFSARARRDLLRKTWVPTGRALQRLEDELGIVIRFIVGRSDQADDPQDRSVRAETKEFGDIVRLDSTDTYADLARKTLKLFSKLPDKFDASFYFKVDDDVIVNVKALAEYLRERRSRGNLYMGCMKSGAVLTDKKYKWYEPDAWRFGDGATGGAAQYMRHASGQFYGVSAPVARYIKQNAPILHHYANEDITVGTWMLGLDVDFVNERRMCCANADECQKQKLHNQECLGFFEMACAGICNSDKRLVPLYNECIGRKGQGVVQDFTGFAQRLRGRRDAAAA